MRGFLRRLFHLFSDDDIAERLAVMALLKEMHKKIGLLMELNRALSEQIEELKSRTQNENIQKRDYPENVYRSEK